MEESDSSDDSPVQSPKREKPKKHKPVGKQATNTNHNLPQGGGLGDRGGGDQCGPGCRCPRCRQQQPTLVHGKGCDCKDCVPHGRGCKCPDCVPVQKHGKGCKCTDCAPTSSPQLQLMPVTTLPSSPPSQPGGYGGQQLPYAQIFQPTAGGGGGGSNLSAYLAYSQQQATSYLAHSQQQSTSFLNYMAGSSGYSRLD